MTEKIISLENIETIHIYGVKNVNLERIKKHFPKLKIMARGNLIKVFGEEKAIELFEEKMELLLQYYEKYNTLNEQSIDKVMQYKNADTFPDKEEDTIIYGHNGKPIKPRSARQHQMVKQHHNNDLLFVIGPAGTGKTYLAIALAVRALRNRTVKRIILSRPAVEAEEHLGFLPGDMKEKLDPYLQPLYDALNDMIPARKLQDLMDEKIIQIAPLAFMRGRTLGNAFVILDEAQNATTNQLKMFLTRMGEHSKFIITGDITQVDLPDKQKSGLVQAQKLLNHIDGISTIHFQPQDIIRHKLVQHIVNAYDKLLNNNI